MLLQGRGYEAIAISAMGSFGAIVICLLTIFPLRFLIGEPLFLYSTLQEIMAWVLIAISILMITTEHAQISFGKLTGKKPILVGMLFALFVFALSGVFGLIILDLPIDSPVGLQPSVLFPGLAGLFGMPTLLNSLMTRPHIPPQKIEKIMLKPEEKKPSVLSIITGSFAGILVSIIPGITSATGTILAMNARGESGNEQTIVTLSAVNTASAFSVIAVLFIILRPRSGAALAVNELILVEEWTGLMIPNGLLYLLMFLVLAGGLSYLFTLKIGKIFAQRFTSVPYALLVSLTVAMIVCLVVVFTGVMGLMVLIVATLIGFLPVCWGVRRSHCMGVLLIPIILHFL
jgi:putative membrane protein